MRSVRLFLLVLVAAAALAVAAGAAAMRPGPVEDGTLSVRDGRAVLQLRLTGGVIGRFARGKLTVTEPAVGASTIVVRGARRTRYVNARTTVYQGANIRYRLSSNRRFTVRIDATKINLSAVGLGDGWLDGRGNMERGIYFDGSYSLNGEAYRSLPDEREPIELAAVPTDE
jgi:hypothetical protein